MKTFKQILNETKEPNPESHPLHKTALELGFKHKTTLQGTHNYRHPETGKSLALHKTGYSHSGDHRSGAEATPENLIKSVKTSNDWTKFRKNTTDRLKKEDAPDSPYQTPGSFTGLDQREPMRSKKPISSE